MITKTTEKKRRPEVSLKNGQSTSLAWGIMLGCGVLLFALAGEAMGKIGESPLLADPEVNATQSIFGDFRNPTYTSPPAGATAPQSTAFFNGTVCNNSNCPTDGSVRLQHSAFGQAFGNKIPYPEFVQDTVDGVRKRLYYGAADNIPIGSDDPDNGSFSRLAAAFRYKDLIYGQASTGEGIVNLINARDPNVDWASLYGEAERQRIIGAERLLRNALKYAPGDRGLRQILLDLFYDRAVAEVVTAKERFADVGRIRFIDPVPNQPVVNQEIAVYDDVIAGYEFALSSYFELLRDPVGVNTQDFDPQLSENVPFGYYVFQQEVPSRALHGATYLDAMGQLRDTLNDAPLGSPFDATELFSGFKDLVLLFDLLADFAEAVKEQTRLYAMRGVDLRLPADQDMMRQLVKEAHEKIFLEGNLLLGIFPESSLPGPGHSSGLYESIQRWSQALTELSGARGWIEGDTNVLGFNPDFLMLIQNNGPIFDSYDSLISQTEAGPLAVAKAKQLAARNDYDTYRGTADQLATEYQNRRTLYDDRLFQIVGAHRCNADGTDCSGQCPDFNGACYATPQLNEGSAIQMQMQSIEIATLRIEQNLVRMENLHKQIEIEIDRRGKVAGVEDAISQVYINYGDRQARLTDAITRARVNNARVQRNVGIINGIVSGATTGAQVGGVYGAIIGGVLGGLAGGYAGNSNVNMEKEIGRVTAEKERLAAAERAEINDLNGDILDINSAAQIKTWWLEASTIALDIAESEMLVAQEMSRLKSLTDEVLSTERRMDQENEFIASRYFADPIHRLRMQQSMIDAELTFDAAREWVFYSIRAFEYKWNFPFLHYTLGKFWDENSVFEVRNADELDSLVQALKEKDSLTQTLVRDDYFDWFSVRENFFGYRAFVSGQLQMYPDPETGELVNAYEAFRSQLMRSMDSNGNIVLNFSTVREIPGGSFFRGPRYLADGTLLSKGLFQDKINWLKISLPGSHSLGYSQVLGTLTYGGTSFIRDWDVGMVVPGNPDHVVGEMTPYSTRYWFYDVPSDSWQFQEGLTAPVQMQLAADPRIPPTVPQINVFKERSVAATGWRLVISTRDLGVPIININELDDIELYFYHNAVIRP